jgi:hypothetical protein
MPNIHFKYRDEYSFNVFERPKPAKEFIPKWYRDLPPYMSSPTNPTGKFVVENYEANATAKKCTPMLDAMTAGYVIPLWSDVQVRQVNGAPLITWKVEKDVFELHGAPSREIPAPPGYDKIVFKYVHDLWIQTDPGYSISVSAPAGHYNQPFLQIPAVIDTDNKEMAPTPFPVWIKSGFEGVVEKGTPICQVVPFKRENWTHDFSLSEENEYRYALSKWKTKLSQQYVNRAWAKKRYE